MAEQNTETVASEKDKKRAEDFDLSTLANEVPTEKAEETKPEAKPEPKPAPVSKHPPRLRSKALSYGATPEWIDSLETDDLVDRIREYEDQLRAQQAAKDKPPEPKSEEEDDFQFSLDNERDYDAETVKLLKQTAKATYKAATKKFDERLKKEREESDKKTAQAQQQALYDRIDEAFDELPDALQKYIGRDNPAFQGHRNTVFHDSKTNPAQLPSKKKLVEILTKAGYRSFGIEPDETKPETKPEAEPEKTNGNGRHTAADYRDAQLGRPTATKTKKTKGQQEADLELQETMRELGFRGVGRKQADDFSELPD